MDGINCGDGYIRQFVAMPLGKGYTVEHRTMKKLDVQQPQDAEQAAEDAGDEEEADKDDGAPNTSEMNVDNDGDEKEKEKIFEDVVGIQV